MNTCHAEVIRHIRNPRSARDVANKIADYYKKQDRDRQSHDYDTRMYQFRKATDDEDMKQSKPLLGYRNIVTDQAGRAQPTLTVGK